MESAWILLSLAFVLVSPAWAAKKAPVVPAVDNAASCASRFRAGTHDAEEIEAWVASCYEGVSLLSMRPDSPITPEFERFERMMEAAAALPKIDRQRLLGLLQGKHCPVGKQVERLVMMLGLHDEGTWATAMMTAERQSFPTGIWMLIGPAAETLPEEMRYTIAHTLLRHYRRVATGEVGDDQAKQMINFMVRRLVRPEQAVLDAVAERKDGVAALGAYFK